jgi:hypothetical protein
MAFRRNRTFQFNKTDLMELVSCNEFDQNNSLPINTAEIRSSYGDEYSDVVFLRCDAV